MTFNHLTGFTLSALLHAGLIGLAMAVSNEPSKLSAPLEKTVLTVSLFQDDFTPPPKPAPATKIAPVVTAAVAPKPIPAITKIVTKVVTEKVPNKAKPSKRKSAAKVVIKKVSNKPSKKLVRKKAPKPIRKIVKKTAPQKNVKRTPAIKNKPKKIARKTTRKVQRRPTPPAKKVIVKARKSIAPQRNKPASRYAKNNAQNTPRTAIKHSQKTRKKPARRTPITAKTPAQNTNLSQQYKAQLQRLIASKKRYPKRARRRGHQGRVTLSFSVTHSGNISNIRVIKGARDNDLNIAAIKAIKQASGRLRYPKGMLKTSLTLTITLSYILS